MDSKIYLVPTGHRLITASFFFWLIYTAAAIIFTILATLFTLAHVAMLWSFVLSLLAAFAFVLGFYIYRFPLLHELKTGHQLRRPITGLVGKLFTKPLLDRLVVNMVINSTYLRLNMGARRRRAFRKMARFDPAKRFKLVSPHMRAEKIRLETLRGVLGLPREEIRRSHIIWKPQKRSLKKIPNPHRDKKEEKPLKAEE